MKTDLRVDSYVAKAAPFAKPILIRIRDLVHRACPSVQETMKWGQPFFECNGQVMCFMAGFKEHCTFRFWAPEMRGVMRQHGGFGRIRKVQDLPRKMRSYIERAAALAASGKQTSPMAGRTKKPKAELPLHPEFAAALERHKKAAAALGAFPPGRRREYVAWINDAKSDQTRSRRIATAVKWIAQGKSLNWRYESR
jgi:uncharacterized protein YdeI (YjbR/CyaY-like superfamily)